MKYFDSIYLDLEKDIVLDLYRNENSYFYILRTPNHHSGNLVSNLAKLSSLPVDFDENGLKIIKGTIPTFINEENERIHILKLAGKTVAVISEKGKVMRRATIPAIAKTLMSQTKDYQLDARQTFVKSYIEEPYRMISDVHTHMNACLNPDILIALGMVHQIRYPYYYILKLDLKITEKQEKALLKQREKVALDFADSPLVGKYKERRINDNTFINFADLILNNLENAKENIAKIRASLTILKDGQAVFTNLEKLYLYRYVFTRAEESKKKIVLKNISKLPDKEISHYLQEMLEDRNNPDYQDNSILEDKLLWIGRMYGSFGVEYVEISNTTLVKNNDEPLILLKQAHRILPLVEKETGVRIRFLAALRRIPLTIVKDSITPENYLRENLDVLKAVGWDPYVAGCDFVGEEINEIRELQPVIKEIVDYCRINPYFTIRIHAGENDAIRSNMADSIRLIKESLNKGQKMPIVRLGHGLYTPSLKSAQGKQLMKELKENNIYLEFQLSSNVRLNNLSDFKNHPLKTYLANGLKALQGSDGCGIYGTDPMDERLALTNILDLNRQEILQMVETEKEIIATADNSFRKKVRLFEKRCNGRSVEETIKAEIEINRKNALSIHLHQKNKESSRKALAKQIKDFPKDKMATVLIGGSFNTAHHSTRLLSEEKEMIDLLLNKLNPKKYFFVIGNQLSGYEKYLYEHRGNFEVYAIVPYYIDKSEKIKLQRSSIPVAVSTEALGMGIYKSFNYWLFERRPSVVIAIEGNSAAANTIQEAKNGKARALIFVSERCSALKQKAQSLKGYVQIYRNHKDVLSMIRQIKEKSKS